LEGTTVVATEDLLRESGFIDELARIGIILTGRMLRNYVVKELLPTPIKIPGQGNVIFYESAWIERVKVIHQLVKEGESLKSIKRILSSAKASDGDLLDYISKLDYLDVRRYVLKQLKEGKTLNEAKKNDVVAAKETFRQAFDKKYGKGRYQRLTDDFFHILAKYKHLYPAEWDKDDILEFFGFRPEGVDFSDRKAVRVFKRDFFKKLGRFLKEKQAELEGDIRFCDESVKGYDAIIKEL
jgi:DNA-binding transcriptional MerR regulator